MAEATPLTELEQSLLRALVMLAGGSEGVTVHEKAEQLLWGRAVASPGAVSAALARLEQQGFRGAVGQRTSAKPFPAIATPAHHNSWRSGVAKLASSTSHDHQRTPKRINRWWPRRFCPLPGPSLTCDPVTSLASCTLARIRSPVEIGRMGS
jgi:hypothetical protein